MPAKPVKGAFSNFFYARLRQGRIKPRRLQKPHGFESFTWSVANVRKQWARDLYYDARALRNLDQAVKLVPRILAPLKNKFEYDLHHELVHTGTSEHTAYTAKKIKIMAINSGRYTTSMLRAEQVANRGVLQRILRETSAKDFSNPKARAKIIEVLTWDLVAITIQRGEFKEATETALQNSRKIYAKILEDARAAIK